MTLMDDHSQKLWDFILKSKDQVLSLFKEFQVRASQKLKAIRTDIDGEYRGQLD